MRRAYINVVFLALLSSFTSSLAFNFFIRDYNILADSLRLLSSPSSLQNNIGNSMYVKRDDQDSRKDGGKTKASTTEVEIIYTTTIYQTPSSQPSIHSISNTGSAHQQEQPQNSSNNNTQQSSQVSDPNSDRQIENNLKNDQEALRRMIMILSLVGGLGVIAVVATIVIFTRMRARNRKQRKDDDEGNEGLTYELDTNESNHHSDISSNSDSNNSNIAHNNLANNDNASSIFSIDNLIPIPLHCQSQHTSEPSAPPALMLTEELGQQEGSRRRNVISLLSQTTAAPSPSAPSAKELDALADGESNNSGMESPTAAVAIGLYGSSNSSGHHHNHHHHHHEVPANSDNSNNAIISCSRCTPVLLMAPELPPPAYTPSAPPHYDMPTIVEPAIITEAPLSSNNSPTLPSRRHSLGG